VFVKQKATHKEKCKFFIMLCYEIKERRCRKNRFMKNKTEKNKKSACIKKKFL